MTPGCLLQAEAGYNQLDFFGYSLSTWTFAAGGEHQFGSSPFSAYARYQHQDFDFAGLFHERIDGVVAGFRWAFGPQNKSLEERNNRGTMLDPLGAFLFVGGT